MKLVDILARELKEWPEGQKIAEQSQVDNEIYFEPQANGGFYASERADDYRDAIVTISQWQEARDALLKADAKEWNGEGLPPVGVVCEMRRTDYVDMYWKEIEFLCAGSKKAFFRDQEGHEWARLLSDIEFRPIRTPEQIAAEERENDIAEAMKVMAVSGVHTSAEACLRIATAYVDAGYRKHEQK